MKNDTGVIPLRQNVLVRNIPEGRTKEGLILPDGVKLKNRCYVVAVGSGYISNGVIVPLEVGDYVICILPAGAPVVQQDAERGDVVMIREDMILAIDRRPDIAEAAITVLQ